MRKLYRSQTNSMISGVCGGLAHYFGIDPTIVRLAFVFLTFYHMLGLWVYLVLVTLLPQAPQGYEDQSVSINPDEKNQTTKVIGGGLILLGLLALISTFVGLIIFTPTTSRNNPMGIKLVNVFIGPKGMPVSL